NLGQSGSVAWMFDLKGQIVFGSDRYEEPQVLEAALEAGAEDMETDEDSYTIYTDSGEFNAVQQGLRATGIEWESAELAMIPRTLVHVEGADAAKLMKLLEALEDLDDVQKVWTNADIDESLV